MRRIPYLRAAAGQPRGSAIVKAANNNTMF
jgi:hypothetical protein